jgi:integrase
MNNHSFNGRKMVKTADEHAARDLELFLKELGPSRSVERWISGYGNPKTKKGYAMSLAHYMRWLKSKGINLSPDELVQDNLHCIFESGPADIEVKRRHTDWLNEYINRYLIENGRSESTRRIADVAIRSFYKANDAALFDFFRRASNWAPHRTPVPTTEDIRRVLRAVPVRFRIPLVLSWQSGMEITRVLEMDWSFADGKQAPLLIEIMGRKGHRRNYATFIGRDGVEHLKLLDGRGMPAYRTVRAAFMRRGS